MIIKYRKNFTKEDKLLARTKANNCINETITIAKKKGIEFKESDFKISYVNPIDDNDYYLIKCIKKGYTEDWSEKVYIALNGKPISCPAY